VQRNRIDALDLIRFFAAMSVVLYHYISRPSSDAYPLLSEITKFGYLGVPLFFMLSGYVIALSAHNRAAIQFGISRFVRLYPALWAGVIFTIAVMTIFSQQQYSLAQVFANFTLLNDYMGFRDVDGVYWTLKAELKFYACVFLLLACGVFQRYHIWLSAWLCLTITHAVFGQPFFMGWFISPAYSPFFISGIAYYLIQAYGNNLFNYSILILSLIVSSFNGYNQANGFLHSPHIEEKMISVAIIWGFYLLLYFLSTGVFNIKGKKIYVTMGALTYPLYLIHNMAGKALIDYYSNFFSERTVIMSVIFIMICFSWLMHVIVEKPFSTPIKNYLLKIFGDPRRVYRYDRNGRVATRSVASQSSD